MRRHYGVFQMTSNKECAYLRAIFYHVAKDLQAEDLFHSEMVMQDRSVELGMNLWFYNRFIMNESDDVYFTINIEDGRWIKTKDDSNSKDYDMGVMMDLVVILLCRSIKTLPSFVRLCKRIKLDPKIYNKIRKLYRRPFSVTIVDKDFSEEYECGFEYSPSNAIYHFLNTGWKKSMGISEENDNAQDVNYGTLTEEDMNFILQKVKENEQQM